MTSHVTFDIQSLLLHSTIVIIPEYLKIVGRLPSQLNHLQFLLKCTQSRQHQFLLYLMYLTKYSFLNWCWLYKIDKQSHIFLYQTKIRLLIKHTDVFHTLPNIPNQFCWTFHGFHSLFRQWQQESAPWIPGSFEKTQGALCFQGTEDHK